MAATNPSAEAIRGRPPGPPRDQAYDRTALRRAAGHYGDTRPVDVERRLQVAANTAWRLWHGTVAPSGELAAAVERAYGLPASALLIPAPPVEAAQ